MPSISPLVTTYTLSFLEKGLLGGITWSVTVTGTNLTLTGTNTTNRTNPANESNITFSLANGSYHYTIGAVTGYTASPAAGSVTVHNANLNLTITFGQKVEFLENGLPGAKTWTLEFSGQTQTNKTTGTANSTTNTTGAILFVEPFGVFNYEVGNVPDNPLNAKVVYVPNPVSGHVIVNGTNMFITVGISFTSQPAFHVVFSASRLPPSSTWSVQIGLTTKSNTTVLLGHSNRTSLGKIGFPEPAGILSYNLTPPTGYGIAKVTGPNSPSLTAGDVTDNVTWTVVFGILVNLTFNQSALPQFKTYPGASWKVTLTPTLAGGPPAQSGTSTNTTLNITIPAGAAYHFAVTGPSEYKIAPSAGGFVMPAHNVTKVLRFKLLADVVVFTEHGLDHGLNWTVKLTSGTTPVYVFPIAITKHGGLAISFHLPVGTYNYTISSTGTQTPTPASGTITITTVPSAPLAISVTFA